MDITPTAIEAVRIITPRRHEDARGWFSEIWSRAAFAAAGIDLDWVQDNQSLSRSVGVIRGLHFQRPPVPQAKLVRVLRGAILDVAVDLRAGSPTFGRHVAVELSAANGRQLLIPAGFAHGFVTRARDTEVAYKVDGPYAPHCDAGVRFDDPALAIDWGIDPARALLSDKDRALPTLAELGTPFP